MTLQFSTIKHLLLLILIAFGTSLMAQPKHPQKKEHQERIKAARIGHITQELNLTPEQAEKFWPIYNEFNDKQRSYREEFKSQLEGKNPDELTDDDKRKIIDFEITMKEKELQLAKEYKTKFLEILTLDQMIALRHAEDEFRKMLLERVRHREHNRHEGQPHEDNIRHRR